MFIPTLGRRRSQDTRPLWDQPVLPLLQGGSAQVVASPTDPGCQGRPTVVLTTFGWVAADFDHYPAADCYSRDEDVPVWAGEPRGLFRFNAHAVPARTHGGLASQAAIEARLGRSIPDPADPTDDVWYWDTYPRLFHVRNDSSESVEIRFLRTSGCALFAVVASAGAELDIGPFFGDSSHVLTQLVGSTAGSGSAPTVPSGVDVRVTAPVIADPGETFDFSCQPPAIVQVAGYEWDETFEGTGYVETWDLGETVTGAAVLDEDAAVPMGAPTWWGSQALRVQVSAGEQAFVRHAALSDPLARSWMTLGLYVTSESLADGDAVSVAHGVAATGATVAEVFVARDFFTSELTVNLNIQPSGLIGFNAPISIETFYLIEVRWDQAADEWAWFVDGVLIAEGAISGTPASADHRISDIRVGASRPADSQVDYSVGRFVVTTGRLILT